MGNPAGASSNGNGKGSSQGNGNGKGQGHCDFKLIRGWQGTWLQNYSAACLALAVLWKGASTPTAVLLHLWYTLRQNADALGAQWLTVEEICHQGAEEEGRSTFAE